MLQLRDVPFLEEATLLTLIIPPQLELVRSHYIAAMIDHG
jgi:hypothetical protein